MVIESLGPANKSTTVLLAKQCVLHSATLMKRSWLYISLPRSNQVFSVARSYMYSPSYVENLRSARTCRKVNVLQNCTWKQNQPGMEDQGCSRYCVHVVPL